MEFAIETNNLTKYYGSFTAVFNLNLKVRKGTIHGLVGENGAGKTTILKMLAGITQPSSGYIKVFDYIMDQGSWPFRRLIPNEAKRQIAYLPENPSAYETLTVIEFLSFIGKLYGVPSDLLKERISEYVRLLDLKPYLGTYIGSFSRGWLQRALICSILIRDPAVMLLDEPFYGLDPMAAWKFKRILEDLKREGKTILQATHLLDTAEKLCDRITILKKGVVIREGSLQELRKQSGKSLSLEEVFLKLTAE